MKIGLPISTSKTQYYINQAYVDYIVEAGLEPVLIFPSADVERIAIECGGLLLPGGIDLDPIYYGRDNYTSFDVDPAKDEFERSIFYAFIGQKKPIFGICRGFQLIANEYLEYRPELSEFAEFCEHMERHSQQKGQSLERNICQHFVQYFPARLYAEKGRKIEWKPVNSMHHQGLTFDFGKEKIGKVIGGFRVAAWTDRGLKESKDGNPQICEAFVITDWGSPILAVQWHPEELRDYKLLQDFFLNKAKPQVEPKAEPQASPAEV